MSIRIDYCWRLEPDPQQRDLTAGFAAPVHDPAWFLARQWQMGENQGENASTPVRVDYETTSTAIEATEKAPDRKPAEIPAEAIVENEPDDWWTTGRRLRIGAAVLRDAGLRLDDLPGGYRFATPPPPYDRFAGAADGLALWRNPPAGLGAAAFDPYGVPVTPQPFWESTELVYEATFPVEGAPTSSLRMPRHRGGRVDWFSADAEHQEAIGGAATPSFAFPAPLEYPGAPATRWWEIEDGAVDIGGYPPDSSHFATTLLIELICSHSDDWFLFPVDAPVGHINTLTRGATVVTDSFGKTYTVDAPADWWLFRTTNMAEASLVLWLRAVTPIEGDPIEDVVFGLDEYSNVLWAVEQRVDNRDVVPPTRTAAQEDANPPLAPAPGQIDPASRAYSYVPAKDTAPYWHPYQIENTDNGHGPRRRFVQRRMADLSRTEPELLPAPTAEVLRVRTNGHETVHEIEPATMPSIGTHIQRRYKLARDVTGKPLLWIERRRTPVLRPPSRAVRFDVLAETASAAE
jgi:hypothetical protein